MLKHIGVSAMHSDVLLARGAPRPVVLPELERVAEAGDLQVFALHHGAGERVPGEKPGLRLMLPGGLF